MNSIYIVGGGTFTHTRPHLSLAAPAFGTLASQIESQVNRKLIQAEDTKTPVHLVLTRMAGGRDHLVTNDDLYDLVDELNKMCLPKLYSGLQLFAILKWRLPGKVKTWIDL